MELPVVDILWVVTHTLGSFRNRFRVSNTSGPPASQPQYLYPA